MFGVLSLSNPVRLSGCLSALSGMFLHAKSLSKGALCKYMRQALQSGKQKATFVFLAMLGIDVGPHTAELRAFLATPQCEEMTEAFTESDFLLIINELLYKLEDSWFSLDVLVGPRCARMFFSALLFFPSARLPIFDIFRRGESRFFYRLLKASAGSPEWTATLVANATDAMLASNMPTLLEVFEGGLPPAVVQREGLLRGLAPRMQQNFVESVKLKIEAETKITTTPTPTPTPTPTTMMDLHSVPLPSPQPSSHFRWNVSTTALLSCLYNVPFYMPSVDFQPERGQYADPSTIHFGDFCSQFDEEIRYNATFSKPSIARLFAECLENFSRLCEAGSPNRRVLLRYMVESCGKCPAVMMEALNTAFPQVFDETMPECALTGDSFNTFGYRLLQRFEDLRSFSCVKYLRTCGFVKRYMQQHLRELRDKRGLDFRFRDFMHFALVMNGSEIEEEQWLQDLSSASAPVADLARFVMQLYLKYNGPEWLMKLFCTVDRLGVFREKHQDMYADLEPSFILYYGSLVQDFYQKYPGTMNTDDHNVAMKKFTAARKLRPDADIVACLECTRHPLKPYLLTHRFPLAASYSAFNDSLRCLWLCSCVQSSIAVTESRQRDVSLKRARSSEDE